MRLSNRIKEMQFSPIRELAPLGEATVTRGIKVHHLNIGQPDIETPETFMEGIRTFDAKTLKYTSSHCLSTLIDSCIRYYKNSNIDFESDEIIITNGGSEAILFALMSICDDGDEIIIPEPFYTNYNGFSCVARTKVVPFQTKAEEGFHLPTKEEIISKITNKTRAILISNPGNPTGVVYTKEEIRMLGDIAKEYDIYLIADEVYREFVYDGLQYTSALYLEDILDRVVLIDSVSKRYSACGARIGLIASKNKKLMKEVLKLAQSRLCVPTVEQFACANLINTPQSYFDKVLKEYTKRRDILYCKLSKIPGVICKKPCGAFYIIAKLPIKSSENFAKWLLTDFNYNNETVMVSPAHGFYSSKDLGINEIRLSYCLNSELLEHIMDIFAIALEQYQKIEK